jgi:uncharacterized membrane protein (UPF0136 family)
MKIWILWIYIALLLGGGWVGYSVGKSKVSLIMATVFAILLALCAASVMPLAWPSWLLAMLALVFTMRLAKTKKFIPSGLMLALTLGALGLWLFN